MTATARRVVAMLALGGGQAWADTVPGQVLVKDGDVLQGTRTGGAVLWVNPPLANADGSVGHSVRLDTGEECALLDGVVVSCADPGLYDDGEESGSCNARGAWARALELTGTSREVIVAWTGPLATAGVAPPTFAPPAVVTYLYRPQVGVDDTVWFVASIDTTGGTTTDHRALFAVPGGDPARATVVLQSGDDVGGLVLDASSAGLDADFRMSEDGRHWIVIGDAAGAASAEDGFVAVDGVVVAREGAPGARAARWDHFDTVDVNAHGAWVFSGDSDGPTAEDELVAWAGGVLFAEGDVVAGQLLASPASVSFVGLDGHGAIAHGWSHAGGEAVFVTCDPHHAAATTRVVVAEGDGVDEDGDGAADYVVEEITTSSGSGGRYRSDRGDVFLEARVDVVGGPSGLDALLRFHAPCCADRDVDGVCDADDPCPDDPGDDGDGDGVCDGVDLCAGDDAAGDADGDGVCADLDPCPDDPGDDGDGDGVCDGADACVGDDWTGDADGDGLCDDLDLGLLVGDLVPGDPVELVAFHGTAGHTAYLLATLRGLGAGPCLGATCSALRRPVLLGAVPVDAAGVARLVVPVPHTLPSGTWIALQGLVSDGVVGDTTPIVLRQVR